MRNAKICLLSLKGGNQTTFKDSKGFRRERIFFCCLSPSTNSMPATGFSVNYLFWQSLDFCIVRLHQK
ncbi:hypothetical protein P5673_018558, partial [Acropora cervicornis]